MRKIGVKIFFFIIVLLISSYSFSQESKSGDLTIEEARGLYSFLENIKEQKSLFQEEVNAANLKSLIKDEYANEIQLYEGNPNALTIMECIFVEAMKNNLISFDTYISIDSILSDEECIKAANDWNNRHSFSTVSYKKNEFCIQYYMVYTGGVHADNLNDTIEWFIASAVQFEDYLNGIAKQKDEKR